MILLSSGMKSFVKNQIARETSPIIIEKKMIRKAITCMKKIGISKY